MSNEKCLFEALMIDSAARDGIIIMLEVLLRRMWAIFKQHGSILDLVRCHGRKPLFEGILGRSLVSPANDDVENSERTLRKRGDAP